MRTIVMLGNHHTTHPDKNASVDVLYRKLTWFETVDAQIIICMFHDSFLIY